MFQEELVSNRRSGVVAVEVAANRMVFFYHEGNGFRTEEEPFAPFVLLSSPEQLDGFDGAFDLEPLSGQMLFCTLAKFPDIDVYNAALAFLKKSTRAPYSIYRDLSQQALLESETRLFGAMSFPELRRLSFDLETLTTPGYDFPNADRPGDEIIIISLRDSSGWETVLSQETMSEKELIETFLKVVAERDPDVVEGHNICRFDLPYLETRARRYKLKLTLGRDGSAPRKRPSRFTIAERLINYTRYEFYGRHTIDTLHLAMFYDM